MILASFTENFAALAVVFLAALFGAFAYWTSLRLGEKVGNAAYAIVLQRLDHIDKRIGELVVNVNVKDEHHRDTVSALATQTAAGGVVTAGQPPGGDE